MDVGGGQRVGHSAEGAKVKLWNGRSLRTVPLGNHMINCACQRDRAGNRLRTLEESKIRHRDQFRE